MKKGDQTTIACPECSADTNLVIKERGKDKRLFLGCPNWPICTHTEPIPESFKMKAAGQPTLF